MLAGDHLYYRTTKGTEAAIPLSRLSNVLIADETYRKTPGWAVVLAVLLFPIGLLFLLSKNDVPQSRITVYVKGNPPTPITFWRPVPGGNAQAEWYPALAAIGGSR
jgi:hypothetical protein